MMMETTGGGAGDSGNKGTENSGVTTQDKQQGLNGKSTMDSKSNDVKKDGQIRGEKSANSMKEGGKQSNDW